MNHLRRAMGYCLLLVSTHSLFAGTAVPLTFEVKGDPPVTVKEYSVTASHDPLQLNVHIGSESAEALRKLSARHVGQTLMVKQGEQTLFTPVIREPLQAQDFMISFKSAKDLQDFQTHVK